MDAKPEAVAEEVRANRASLDARLDQLEERMHEADPRRLQYRVQESLQHQGPALVGMLAVPAVAAGVWAYMRTRRGSLSDLLVRELAELQTAEETILAALTRMARGASSHELRLAFERHRRETEGHVERLARVWRLLHRRPARRRNQGIEGLVEEGRRALSSRMTAEARDAALIAAAQKVEHYEIASYGTARAHARTLRCDEAATLLEQTLEEERAADEKLTSLATKFVNPDAAERPDTH
jgi:ferritin-like metal-binding protein YciE